MITIVNIFSYIFLICIIRLALFNFENYKKIFTITAGVILFFIVSLRTIYYGSDVIGYVNKFLALEKLNLEYIFSYDFYQNEKDPVFYYLAKFISFIGIDYQGWIAILSGFFILAICFVIYKYSEIPLISFLLILSLGYLTFGMTGLRQGMSIAIVLLSYKFIRERKLWKFILIIFIASLFHSSSLIFIIAYPISYLRLNSKHIYIFIFILIGHVFFTNQIVWLIDLISWSDHYTSYLDKRQGLNYTGFMIQLIILLFCLTFKKSVLENDSQDITLYNLIYIGVIFQLLSTEIAELFRVSMYFSIFSTILIANAINTIQDKYLRNLASLIIIVAACFYIMWHQSYDGFVFFWNY